MKIIIKLTLYDIIKYFENQDGLSFDWGCNRNIFINPPYGRNKDNKTSIYDWVKKANISAFEDNNDILMLIPVATNTKHFKEIIFKYSLVICFLNDTRLKFYLNGVEEKKGAPMACCIVYFFGGKDEYLNEFGFSKTCMSDFMFNKFKSIFGKFGKCLRIK